MQKLSYTLPHVLEEEKKWSHDILHETTPRINNDK